ncbi:MAG: ABC transporter substrate-binding protein [Proteobacteria bacterium]|nr:MAG: ABC transporter substrate-binding protein [Pseudomonadota bacterium]PIE67951.1 MAG: ABC transporter substrate-binding protein [Deltaproteobacteria bacterium]
MSGIDGTLRQRQDDFLRLPAGLEKPQAGTIRIDDKVVSSKDTLLPAYDRSIGMVFQDLALWPHLSVRQQLSFVLGRRLSRPNREQAIAETIDRFRLGPFESVCPHQLSGGEKQRLALARATINRPKILLLDEPFTGLDLQLKNDLLAEIQHIQKNMRVTCVFVTHHVAEAECLADRIVTIRNGRFYPFESEPGQAVHRPARKASFVCYPGGRQ